MKLRLTIIFVLLLAVYAHVLAQMKDWPRMSGLKMKEIRTASDKILIAYFLGPEINGVKTESDIWSLNGAKPVAITKWITPNWEGIGFGYEHHIYLNMAQPFKEGQKYTLKTPHGDTTFIFNSENIFCESFKTNQSAYSALASERFANFAIWTGTGGGKNIEGKLPAYKIIEEPSGKIVKRGTFTGLAECKTAGDYVYRINLSGIPEGGPYKVVVNGYGSSYPFGVGGEYSRRLGYVSFRGLLHQRCGMEQKQPYFDHNIREACHAKVYLTESPGFEAKITIRPGDPVIKTYGGYHDAGDADRRDHHMVAPIALLSYYDMFPAYFRDLQFNIPDKFDANHQPVGQGNGIPDVIDEAEWGTAIFELLQDSAGGVRSGTERNGYPKDGVCLDSDTVPYGAFRISKNSTCLAAGLFAHLARALKPYNPIRAAELQKRAEKAWHFAGETALITHKFYFYTQYYLLTGDGAVHQKLIELAPSIKAYETQQEGNPRNTADKEVMLGAYFFSYILQNERSKDPGVVKMFQEVLKTVADKRIAELNATYYPNGTLNPNRWWGSQTAQGQYADPLLMMWRLTKEQKYINAACQLMDYNLGLNPLGKSYMTGTGFDRTEDPLHHDSYPMKDKGWGPAPGLLVFGPGNLKQIKEQCPVMIPDIHSLPPERQYLDSRRHVSANEFTIPESLAYPSVIYTILAEGGIWDRKTDLFTNSKP